MEIEQQQKTQEILKSIANGNVEEKVTTTPQQNGNSSPPPPPQEKETSSKPSAVSASAKDPEKRKSVSFVDEKLIINAIKSTSINDNNNDSVTTGATQQPVKRSNSLKSNGKYGDGNKRQTFNNQKHYSNNFTNHHHHHNHNNNHHHNNNNNQYVKHQKQHGYDNVEKSSSTTSINHSNPVIIYYGSPDVKIDVDDLLNKCQQIQQPKQQQQQQQQQEKKEESINNIEKKNQQKSFNSKSKMNSTIANNNTNTTSNNHNNNNNNRNQSNHYRNHNNKNYGQNYGRGGHRYNNNHNHHHHHQQNNGSSGFGGSNNDNWRSNQNNHNNHQNNIKKYSDHDDRCADGKNYGEAIGGGNRGGFFKKRGNGHFNGGAGGSRDNRKNFNVVNNNESGGNKAEPITIYYNDATVSLEENLELVKTKLKEKIGNTTDLETDEAEAANKNDDDDNDNNDGGDKTTEKSISSQLNNDVINLETKTETNTKTEQIANVGVESEVGDKQTEQTISPIIASNNTNNHEDVISGGVPIENPSWPKKPGPHKVACTLVSHPGHFYIKFLINEQHQKQLSSMTEFYQNEEHIELTIDVLKPGQYFAASTNDEKEIKWIRVKLLHIESSDSINCLLIDEGCFGVFKLNKLQPLYNRFRSVPKQAIRVALSGVRPKENDWLPNEALEFKKLIENRLLKTGAYVGSDDDERKGQTIDPDQTNGNSTTEIELFFNEDDQDTELANKSVADVLIERNIATKK